MILEIKIPSPGESITEVEIGKWLVENGAIVKKDQEIAEIESDKATLSLTAAAAGQLSILVNEGERVAVGTVVCTVDSEGQNQATQDDSILLNKKEAAQPVKAKVETAPIAPPLVPPTEKAVSVEENHQIKLTPAAKAVMDEASLSMEDLLTGLRRISRKDVETVLAFKNNTSFTAKEEVTREEDRLTMSALRRKLSQRLVTVKNETAMLTTFNEIDMIELMNLRKTYQQPFVDKFGIKLGFMSFFTMAVSVALSKHPSINSMIDGDDIVTPPLPRYRNCSPDPQRTHGTCCT